jgi:hypothetical protein
MHSTCTPLHQRHIDQDLEGEPLLKLGMTWWIQNLPFLEIINVFYPLFLFFLVFTFFGECEFIGQPMFLVER